MSPDAIGPLDPGLLAELEDFLAIASVSSDPDRREDVVRAARWVADAIERAGGTAQIHAPDRLPLVTGHVPASKGARTAPTVMLYAHYDVQPVQRDAWDYPPFAATLEGDWLYGRGTADDKGQLFMLVKAVQALTAAGRLPVNVRFICDGDEEIGGTTAADYLRADTSPPDVFVSFDGTVLRGDIPTFDVGCRGLIFFRLEMTTAPQNLHSGLYGGPVLNAYDALARLLTALRGPDGTEVHPRLADGVEAIPDAERGEWAKHGNARDLLSSAGALPAAQMSDEEIRERLWARPALDINGIHTGDPVGQTHIIPARALAHFSIRLAPGQDPQVIDDAVRELLAAATPEGAQMSVTSHSATPPATVNVDNPWVEIARKVFTRTVGHRPVMGRSGGTLPIMAAVAERGIPGVFTGFNHPDSRIHDNNERLQAAYLPLGIATITDLLLTYGDQSS